MSAQMNMCARHLCFSQPRHMCIRLSCGLVAFVHGRQADKPYKSVRCNAALHVTAVCIAGQAEHDTRMSLAEWMSERRQHSHGRHSVAAAGSGVILDLSLEKLPGFGDLLHTCAWLVSLEATGNNITSLAGTPDFASKSRKGVIVLWLKRGLTSPL